MHHRHLSHRRRRQNHVSAAAAAAANSRFIVVAATVLAVITFVAAEGNPRKLHSPDFEAFRRRFDETEAFTRNCDLCKDITSSEKCRLLLPTGKTCDDPGYNYLKIFCRRTCNSCIPCNAHTTELLDMDIGEEVVFF